MPFDLDEGVEILARTPWVLSALLDRPTGRRPK